MLSKNFRLNIPHSIKTFTVLRKSIIFTSLCLIRELRSELISAIHEPKEGECQWEVGVKEGAWEKLESEPEGKGQTTGTLHFWLMAF